MKVNHSIWKKLSGVIVLAAGSLFYSCDNNDYSGKSSSSAETGSTPATGNTTVTPGDTSSATNTGRTARMGERKGKVSVAPATVNTAEKMVTDNQGYYNHAEVSPSYNGGQGAIESYITNNIEYPEEAVDDGIEGTVNVQFGIDENGNIANVKTLGPKLGYGLEEEAVKVVSNMGKWIPGTVKGKKVKTLMILPISYRLEG
jgi:periplasmic protein TonB